MARNTIKPVIRKKKKRAAEDSHHGGGWKIAYADFVTAMMAFFLLMWLINVTSPEQKTGIAEYFNPITVSQTTKGSDGVLSGTAIDDSGALRSPTSEVQIKAPLPLPPKDKAPEEERLSEKEFDKAVADREQKMFKKVEEELRKSIDAMPDLRDLAANLIIDQTPEGLRIQIVDRDERPMFPLGSPEPFDHTRQLLTMVAVAIAELPNKVSIKGHTDSLPFAQDNGYDNWDLSSERAQSSRRVMASAGLMDARIEGVVGRADRDPLFPENPTDARNRRISIVLLRESQSSEQAVGSDSVPPGSLPSQLPSVGSAGRI